MTLARFGVNILPGHDPAVTKTVDVGDEKVGRGYCSKTDSRFSSPLTLNNPRNVALIVNVFNLSSGSWLTPPILYLQ